MTVLAVGLAVVIASRQNKETKNIRENKNLF